MLFVTKRYKKRHTTSRSMPFLSSRMPHGGQENLKKKLKNFICSETLLALTKYSKYYF